MIFGVQIPHILRENKKKRTHTHHSNTSSKKKRKKRVEAKVCGVQSIERTKSIQTTLVLCVYIHSSKMCASASMHRVHNMSDREIE